MNINNFTFGKFIADNIKGAVLLKNQKIALKDVTLNATDGTIKLNAFADASSEKIKISGRLDGADIARYIWHKDGIIPLSTLSTNLDYTNYAVNTIYGLLGIKIWLFKNFTY